MTRGRTIAVIAGLTRNLCQCRKTHERVGLFAIDRVGIFVKVKEAEPGATGAYCTVCNRALSEDDAEIGENNKRAAAKRQKIF